MPRELILLTLVFALAGAGCASTKLAPASTTNLFDSRTGESNLALNPPRESSASSIQAAPGHDRICYNLLPLFEQDDPGPGERGTARADGHPAIHGPYSLLLVGDFIAPSMGKLDEAYGVDTRLMVRVVDSFFLGGGAGYARMKNEDSKGLIEGELQRYSTVFWAEYRLTFGKTTWSPSFDFGIGPGWFVAQPVPLSQRRKDIEALNRKLKVGVMSTVILRGAVQLRLPVIRSTDMSVSEGNADLIIGIGADFGKGSARYTITDIAAGIKTKSRGTVTLDAFHAFVGLSFRF